MAVSLLPAIQSTIDLSNLDLSTFEFFKYPSPPSKSLYGWDSRAGYKKPTVSPLVDGIQKSKAVLTYIRHLLFGPPAINKVVPMVFDPEFGRKWSPEYERVYGKHGANLIALLGNGYSREKLIYHGALDKNIHYF